MEAAPSRTAMFAAVSRGLFRMEETPPWVLDDALALVLVGPVWQELRDQVNPLFPGQVARESRAAVCARSRYAEDRLAAGAFTQYVILGAGLDSFAWRRPDLLRSVRVFEVDHPASQAWKLERVGDLALPLSDSQVFVPVDFEAEPLRDALRAAGFDWGQPALFSWTGVAPYLTAQAIESTLRTTRGGCPRLGGGVLLPGRGVGARWRRQRVHPDLRPARGLSWRAAAARLAGHRDRAADQPVRAEGRRPSSTCRPRTAVFRRPDRWPAALQRGDPGHRAGHLSAKHGNAHHGRCDRGVIEPGDLGHRGATDDLHDYVIALL